MTMRASLIITAKDQASAAFGRVAAGARRMGASFRPVQQEARAADRAIDKVGQGAPSHFARVGAAVRKMARDMKIAERAGYGLGYGIGWSTRKMAGFALQTAKWGAIGLASSAAVVAGWFGGGIISTASKFEQFQAALEGTEGSAAKAKAAMAWVAKFAAQTPYELDEVTDAFVRARGVAIDPMSGAMTNMGDAAAANRKTIKDAVEAIADAQTYEFERLKEFNITTSVKGNQVSFSYIGKDGKAALKTVKKEALEVQKAVMGIWSERHGGAMLRQSKTFAGIWANLKDAVTGFQMRIASKGIFDRIKNSLAEVLDWANRLADDGTLDRWAQRISDGLSEAWKWAVQLVKNTDWKQLRDDASRIAGAVWNVARAFAAVMEHASAVAKVVNAINPLSGGLLGFAYRQVTNQSGTTPGQSSAARASPKPAGTNSAPRAWRAPLGGAARSASPAKQMPATRPAAGRGASRTAERDVNVGGKVTVEVRAAPGVQARTTQVQSSNRRVPVQVNTGRSMVGAA